MERQLIQLWYGERARPSALQPLAWLYGAIMALRSAMYRSGWARSTAAGRPLVIVGNLTVGGTGKTPLTIWLARALTAQGLRVGIIARGYGGGSGRGPRRVDASARWQDVGDEALILARRSGCATVVGSDRLAAARSLVATGVDVLLADDGLQHLRLARDCEIVVVDGARGFGNGRLLPAGPLREATARLRTVDAVVVNGSATHASLAGLPAGRTLAMQLTASEAVSVDERRRRPLASFQGARVHAVAGIGNPARFFQELRAHGMELLEHEFPDHHPLTAAELRFADGLPVLMTEKDAVKCRAMADERLWYVPVAAQLTARDADELLRRVLATVHRQPGGG